MRIHKGKVGEIPILHISSILSSSLIHFAASFEVLVLQWRGSRGGREQRWRNREEARRERERGSVGLGGEATLRG